jgi:hypothetical protein
MPLNVDSVVFLEGWEGNEVSVQEHIERFHDLYKNILATFDDIVCFVIRTHNSKTHDKCPEACPGVALRCCPSTLLMLALFGVEGIVHEIRVG